MAKFALLAADKRVSAFYDSEINAAAIPTAAIAISDALWQSWIGQTAAVTFDEAAGELAPYVAPPAPVVIPGAVTRRQFFQAAAQLGLITKDEAKAVVVGGAIPASLATAIAALPASDQFAAEMAVLGAQDFQRANPLVSSLGAGMSQTPAQIDALFTLAATL